MASTSASSRSSAISRLTYPYCSARGPSRSSATRRIFECPAATDQAGEPSHRTAPGNHPDANFPLAEKRVLARGEPQITGENKLAPGAAGASPDRGDADHRGANQTDKDVDPGRQSSGTDPECLSPAGVVLQVIMGQVEIPVGAVEHNDVEVRILLDEAGEVAELGDGRCRDRVNRRVIERHMAVSGVTAFDPAVRPGSFGFSRTHFKLLRWIASHYFRLRGC